jgi:hypothetical protein
MVTSRVAREGSLLEETFGECSPRDSLLCDSGILTLRSSDDASEIADEEGVLSEKTGLFVLDDRRLLFFRSVWTSNELVWFLKKVETRGSA